MQRARRSPALLAGVAAGSATLGVAELLAALLQRSGGAGGQPSPLLAVGDAFVDLTPPWLKDLAVGLFGTADKAALFVGMGLVLLLVCAGVGLLAHRSLPAGLATLVLLGGVGLAAVLTRPDAGAVDALPTVAGVVTGLAVLRRLTPAGSMPADGPGRSPDRSAAPPVPGRRSVLAGAAGVTVLGLLGVVAGRVLAGAGETVRRAREAFRVPAVRSPVTVPAGADQRVEGQPAFVTGTGEFFRIDTALAVPQVDPADWRLRVVGLVEREVELTMADLLDEELVEALVTLTCVSNPVGGDLVGTAVWTGLPVRELLARAGPLPEADMVLSRSVDGFTAGTPLEVLTDDRDALLAVGMNGEPLPPQHGFPARLVVPGLYGYVSATKWVTELRVTRFDADEGYWTPRGWSARGPVKTASRVDVPRDGGRVAAGRVVVAGVAWAQHTGIERVEVRVDDGPWQQATLALEPSVDAWRQWRLDWDAPVGEHSLTVRATDAAGRTQTEQTAPPAPDGATGWHRVTVTVG